MRAFRGSGGNRSATGAYERPSRRGFGALDPDEAWDSRVGGDYYEEQELASHDPYGGSGYAMNLAATPGMPPPGFGHHDEHDEEMTAASEKPNIRIST